MKLTCIAVMAFIVVLLASVHKQKCAAQGNDPDGIPECDLKLAYQ